MASLDVDNVTTEHDIRELEILDYSKHFPFIQMNLRALYNKYAALLRQNFIQWAQRAKMLWLNNGDLMG